MVGMILASHGEFANGILQSGTMIFGEQPDVKAVTLEPSEGPDDLKAKLEAAIATFDNQDEVLFLVDLWGGTPFNQANGLINGHEDQWAIVTGLNLPMLIEAYASRMSMETAHEIATHICEVAREGVKTRPETLEPQKEVKEVVQVASPQGAIPEGTVLGDGHIKFVLARVDTRLLHGQVATTWTKMTQPNRIIVVSDSVAKDNLRKQMIEQAAPPGVKANVVPVSKMIEVAKDPRFGNTKAMLLFETPQDALRAIEGGVDIQELNIGSMAHSLGKVVVNKAIAMGKDDVETLEKLKELGMTFDVRKVPADSKEDNEMSIITIILIIIIALLAGMEGVLDEFQFHQPLVACTLIGLVTGHLSEGIILGGSLQMIALGWANVGAAVAPDAALASVASAIIMVLALQDGSVDSSTAITTSIAVAIPLSVAGLFLTMICRTIAIPMVHFMDVAAEKGSFRTIEMWQILAIVLQGVRIAIPAAALCVVPAVVVTGALNQMPDWLSGGMAVGGGMVAAVGYAMVINMMSSKETWPFFAIGFVLAAIGQLTLIALGVIGVALALIYLGLKENSGTHGGGSGGTGDPLGDILNDY